MYEYKTELLYVDRKKLTGRFDENCIHELDEIINEKTKVNWELVAYSYIPYVDNMYAKCAFAVTFRRKK